jgi:hypothetical protein
MPCLVSFKCQMEARPKRRNFVRADALQKWRANRAARGPSCRPVEPEPGADRVKELAHEQAHPTPQPRVEREERRGEPFDDGATQCLNGSDSRKRVQISIRDVGVFGLERLKLFDCLIESCVCTVREFFLEANSPLTRPTSL